VSLVRVHLCKLCGEPWEEPRVVAQGRSPNRCPDCDPAAAVARAEARVEHRIDAQAEHVEEAGRDRVVRQIRILTHAKGREQTRAVLLSLAAECKAWAAKLEIDPATLSRTRRRSAA